MGRVLMASLIVIALTSCDRVPPVEPELIVSSPRPDVAREALQSGTLAISDTCFVLQAPHGETYSLVWANPATASQVDGRWTIAFDQQRLSVGETITLSGGELRALGDRARDMGVPRDAQRCKAPYFLAFTAVGQNP